jgi:hypothetical protein
MVHRQADQGNGCGFNDDLDAAQLPEYIEQPERQDEGQNRDQVDHEQSHADHPQATGEDRASKTCALWGLAHGGDPVRSVSNPFQQLTCELARHRSLRWMRSGKEKKSLLMLNRLGDSVASGIVGFE